MINTIWHDLLFFGLIILLARFVLRLIKDTIGMINYFRAGVYDGRVLKSNGTMEDEALISGHSTLTHTFENYVVEYTFNGQRLQGNVLTTKRGLKPGDTLAVHVLNNDGIPEIQTNTCGAKVRYLSLVIVFSVAATAALIAFLVMTH